MFNPKHAAGASSTPGPDQTPESLNSETVQVMSQQTMSVASGAILSL